MMLTRREMLLRGPVVAAAALAWRATDARAVPLPSTPVKFDVPAGATDCHRHVIGDETQYPYISAPIARYEPARIADMAAFDRAMHIDRIVLIGLTAYGTNNACLLDGLKQLGKRGRGVPIVDESVTDRDLTMMDRAGCRGIRLLAIGEDVDGARKSLEWAGRRFKASGWSVSTPGALLARLDALADTIAASPVPIVFDHFVGARAQLGVTQPGFQTLLKLLAEGNVYVKLSRINGVSRRGPDYADAVPIAQALIKANPSRMLWGTDWPHPQPVQGYGNTDVSPFLAIDDGRAFNQFAVWAPEPTLRKMILVDNPARLYGF
jgi:predicted TIM-barrel fold metal-dependent hydrolase